MDGPAGFVAAYAVATELAAVGITRLGVITANRQARVVADDGVMPWPHLGSVALHRVIAAVATAAAVLLAAVMAGFHHTGPDLAVLAVPVVFGVVGLGRAAAQLRSALRNAS